MMKNEMIKQHDSVEIDKENISKSGMLQFSRLNFMSKYIKARKQGRT